LIELAREQTIFKAAPPPDPEELARRISTRVPVEELLAQAVVAYIQVALATGEAAGQYTLDALGIDKTFNWAHPRNMGRDLYSVRGSKIIQLAHGSHVDELAKIIHTATDPLRPLTIQQMTSEIQERWSGLEKWQAERIARTESAAVWENMNYNTMRANGVESFDNLVASGPSIGVDVEDACDYCQEMGAGSPWHPDDLGDMPPYHPNCRCTLVPHEDVLPPREPWAGEDIPMCGEEDVWMAKRALIERSMPHVRIKKDAASCALPVPAPDAGSSKIGLVGEPEAVAATANAITTMWGNAAMIAEARRLLASMNFGGSQMVRTLLRADGSVSGVMLQSVNESRILVSGIVTDTGGAQTLLRSAAADAYELKTGLAVNPNRVSPRMLKELSQRGFQEGSLPYENWFLPHDKLKSAFKLSDTPKPTPKLTPARVTPARTPAPVRTPSAPSSAEPTRLMQPGTHRKAPDTKHIEVQLKKAAADSTASKRKVTDALTARLRGREGWDPDAVIEAFDYQRMSYGYEVAQADQNAIGQLINNWARTSSDQDRRALALQIAAREEFGLEAKAFGAGFTNAEAAAAEMAKAEVLLAQSGVRSSLRMFLRAQYDETQALLKQEGISSFTVYRGMKTRQGTLFGDPGLKAVDVTDNPLASWSPRWGVAKRFEGGAMLQAEVPAELVLSTPLTGFGCANEFELVIMNAARGSATNRAWALQAGQRAATKEELTAAAARKTEIETRLSDVGPQHLEHPGAPWMDPDYYKLKSELADVNYTLQYGKSYRVKTQAEFNKMLKEVAPPKVKPPRVKVPRKPRAEKPDVPSTAGVKEQIALLYKKIWNAKNKLNHPEKFGRESWTKEEIDQMEENIANLENQWKDLKATTKRAIRDFFTGWIRKKDAAPEPVNISEDLINADWTKQVIDMTGVEDEKSLRRAIAESGLTEDEFMALPVFHLALASGRYPWMDRIVMERLMKS